MDKRHQKANPILAILVVLYGIYLLYGIGSSMIDRHTVAKLTDKMKTACVGRFLVDLPESMEFSYGQVFLDGFWISTQQETQQAFDTRVMARQAEVDADPNELGRKNLEKLETYEQHGFSGKILM